MHDTTESKCASFCDDQHEAREVAVPFTAWRSCQMLFETRHTQLSISNSTLQAGLHTS